MHRILLVLALLLAGCAGQSPNVDVPIPADNPDTHPIANQSNESTVTPALPEAPAVASCYVLVNAGVGVGNGHGNYLACRFAKTEAKQAGPALVEVEWSALSPAGTTSVWLMTDSCNNTNPAQSCSLDSAHGDGAEVLRLEVPEDVTARHWSDGLRALTSMQLVAVQAEATVWISVFEPGTQIPADYSARRSAN